uniref:Uncharacterized protein MANES_15G051300 n=2 Tax=Rhizophora mucronata TaxID=61149 RepID=A0A2P2K0X5_RHIMU
MAVVMKRLDRAGEAIEAIKSFRHLCSKQAQESLDNVLIDLYKSCGRTEEQIELLKQKLQMICQGEVFNGKPTKTARSHGKKFQVTIKQETYRILGNLGWAYMQLGNYSAAEVVYRKAQSIDPDANKACNLCLCLIRQKQYTEARLVIESIVQGKFPGSHDHKLRNRVEELLHELGTCETSLLLSAPSGLSLGDAFVEGLDQLMSRLNLYKSRRLPVFEEISSFRNQLAC